MAVLTKTLYTFVSKAPSVNDETFGVISFKGFESISKPYEFDITLVSEDTSVDMTEVLNHPATFSIHRDNGEVVEFDGVLAEFEQMQQHNVYVFYRARLVPKLWWLTLTHHNQVRLNETVPGLIEHILRSGGLLTSDYELKLSGEYSPNDYVCQYNESHFNFLSRWAEREGIYYYFGRTEDGETVIFTDTKISHTDISSSPILSFTQPSGLEMLQISELITSFTCRQHQIPAKVFLKDYNYERPSLEITGSADVDETGRGVKYLYGEYFRTPEEGNRLARIRAEEILCRKIEFFGESTVPFIKPGYTFTLNDHYRPDFNKKYLSVEVTHEGNQTGYLVAGVRQALSTREETISYRNNFTAIPADVQFRPQRIAEKTRISGTIQAKVDAEGSGAFAELDQQGRYKVRLPFDVDTEHGPGKASSFVRMMQPYAGNNYGVHFPLHKGAEVQLSFVNGDPDRPVISGSVPNPETVSPVTSSNQTTSVFRDNYGNELIFDSTPGDEHIRIHSPHHKSTIELGRSIVCGTDDDWYEAKAGNTMELGAGNKMEMYAGNSLELKAGMSFEGVFGISNELQIVGKQEALIGYDAGFHWGPEFKLHYGPTVEKSDADRTSIAEDDNILSAKKIASIVGGAGQRSTSIMNLKDTEITLSVGSNKDPEQTTMAMKAIKKQIIAYPLTLSIVSAVLAGGMAATLEIDDAPLSRGFMSTSFGVVEGFTMLLSVIMVMYLGYQLKEKITPVSHFDDPADKIDSLIKLSKEDGVTIETRKRDPMTINAAVELQNNGEVGIYSFPKEDDHKKIEIEVGFAPPEVSMIMQQKKPQFKLAADKTKIWMNKNGTISLENKGATEGKKQIQLLAEKDVYISSQTGDLAFKAKKVYATKGIFETKNIKDLG